MAHESCCLLPTSFSASLWISPETQPICAVVFCLTHSPVYTTSSPPLPSSSRSLGLFDSCGLCFFSSSLFRPFTDSLTRGPMIPMLDRCALCVAFFTSFSRRRRRIALFIFDDYGSEVGGEGGTRTVRGTKNQKYLHSISFDLIVE